MRTDIALFEDVEQLRWKGPMPAFEAIGRRLDAAVTDEKRNVATVVQKGMQNEVEWWNLSGKYGKQICALIGQDPVQGIAGYGGSVQKP